MKAKLTKARAFWAAFWAILLVYFVTLAVDPSVAGTIAPAVVAALAAAGGLYQAASVADNGVKGAHYRPELDREA